MPEEEPLFPMKSLFTLLRVVALLALVIVTMWLFMETKITLHERDLDRALTDLSDAITTQSLTSGIAVFEKQELDNFDGERIEPYTRHCRFGYRIKIETEEKKWEFGYKPGKLDSREVEAGKAFGRFPVAINILDENRKAEYYNTVKPAIMHLEVYDTWLTRITCMIENAFFLKQVQEELFKCPKYLNSFYEGCGLTVRREGGDPNSDYVCIFFEDNGNWRDTTECRYLPSEIPIYEAYYSALYSGSGNKIIKAVPIKKRFVRVEDRKDMTCKDISSYIAGKDDEIGAIRICFEEIS